ncbi:MAG: hypothetical protein WAM52_06440, partial [Steroidobacteraceae bacterium]
GGGGREGGARDSGGGTTASTSVQESGAGEFSASAPANGTHEQHHEPAPARESFAPAPEPREVRDAPARHEEPTAPAGHFEPSPAPTESNASRETKPYVVWSSAPPDHVAPGSGRGPEE